AHRRRYSSDARDDQGDRHCCLWCTTYTDDASIPVTWLLQPGAAPQAGAGPPVGSADMKGKRGRITTPGRNWAARAGAASAAAADVEQPPPAPDASAAAF